jgi:hypothetical protein
MLPAAAKRAAKEEYKWRVSLTKPSRAYWVESWARSGFQLQVFTTVATLAFELARSRLSEMGLAFKWLLPTAAR